MLPFRRRLTVTQRNDERIRVTRSRPGYVPVIMERGSKEAPIIDREKFLVPQDITGMQLSYVVRRRLKIKPAEALFLLCGNKLMPAHMSLGELHAAHQDSEDGFLYVQYSLENTFG